LHRTLIAAALASTCAACEVTGARGQQAREIPAPVLCVRQTANLAGAPADGSEARPFTSLAAALAAAPAGALLRIDEGVYRERVVITRPVVLLGRGIGRTRIVAVGPIAVEVRGADHVQIHGLSIEGGAACAAFAGGSHKLQKIALRGCAKAGLVGREAEIELVASEISDVSGGDDGRGIDLDGGSLQARNVRLLGAGRRAIVLRRAQGLIRDAEVRWSSLAALQAIAGSDARVVGGTFEGFGGAALYAGGARLRVERALVKHAEYAVLGFRGSDVTVEGGELTDYAVAGVAIVNSRGSVQRATIARGGSDAAVVVTHADGSGQVLIADNRISSPGTMGIHVTESRVLVRGNTITGARVDAERDMGDALYAVDSEVVVERNVMRGNAGSGVAAVRSQVRLADNGFIENGRAGLLLLDASRSRATGNTFERNVKAVEVAEKSRTSLVQNRFVESVSLDVDAGCGSDIAGRAELGSGNLAIAGVVRQRSCAR
jgi:hypothetical protein